MPAISASIPNLVGGVSQQSPEIRALNTSTALVNTRSSVVSGLATRPHMEHIGRVGPIPTGDTSIATHAISTPDGDFQITVYDNTVRVTNLLTGAQETVTVVGGANSYLNCTDPARQIGFVTIADTTYIYNKTILVQKVDDADTTTGALGGNLDEGVQRLNPNRYTTVFHRQTTGAARWEALYWNTQLFARNLVADTENTSAAQNALRTYVGAFTAPVNSEGSYFTNGVNGPLGVQSISENVWSIQLASELDWFSSSDGYADQAMRCFNDRVDEFADLPPVDKQGRMFLVKQGDKEDADDYWVYMKNGEWVETYGWNAHEYPNNTTMPVKLFNNGGGSWTLSRETWQGREAGDADSNKTPSFIGQYINHMTVYKGRMIIMAGENWCASEVQKFTNFYRTSAQQLLDDDRIDIATPNSKGATVNWGFPFDDGMLIMTDSDQFMVKGGEDDTLSPNTVAIQKVNSYANSPYVKPAETAQGFILVNDRTLGNWVQCHEYMVDRTLRIQVAPSITDAVPEYIPEGVYNIQSSTAKSFVVVASEADRRKLWVYDYYYNTQGKAQSAWQTWEMPSDVFSIAAYRDVLIVTSRVGSDLVVSRVLIDDAVNAVFDDSAILLDHRLSKSRFSSVTFDGTYTVCTATNIDWSKLPADALEKMVLIVSTQNTGPTRKCATVKLHNTSPFQLRFKGNFTADQFFVGVKYTFEWELSPFYARDRDKIAIQDGVFGLRKVGVFYSRSGPFEVQVTPDGRQTYVKKQTGFVFQNPNDVPGSYSLDGGEFRFSPGGKGDTTKIKIIAETPFRVRFSSIEYMGIIRPRSKRM